MEEKTTREKEREIIRSLSSVLGHPDEERINHFIDEIGVDPRQYPSFVLKILEDAYRDKNEEDLSNGMYLLVVFKLRDKSFVDILCKLLEENWHKEHEMIARELEWEKSPTSVNVLYRTAMVKHEYLAYSDVEPLARICIWALWLINTPESMEKLRLLSEYDNDVIRKYAIEKLIKKKK
jgi:hypothetical protein